MVSDRPEGRVRVSFKQRRRLLLLSGGATVIALLAALAPRPALAISWRNKLALFRRAFPVQPDRAEALRMVDYVVAGRAPRKDLVTLKIPDLVENGEVVPIKISVDCAMTAEDYPQIIHIFALDNPYPEVARYHLLPESGGAEIEMRCRLRTSSEVVAVAEMSDGSVGVAERHVDVTLGACS
jgi:sulfur-oxidizing protein SoxY